MEKDGSQIQESCRGSRVSSSVHTGADYGNYSLKWDHLHTGGPLCASSLLKQAPGVQYWSLPSEACHKEARREGELHPTLDLHREEKQFPRPPAGPYSVVMDSESQGSARRGMLRGNRGLD
uniref:Uncharacterized protein n=1 Tax=Mus musculus TaxID=10090 RepID=Q3UW10_MOUSE|nr:unnamed protein product [Mus musculus]